MKKEKVNIIRARGLLFIIPLAFFVFFSSCRSSYYEITIEVQEPASITLPIDVTELLIVNNAIEQPNDVGIVRTYKESTVDGYPISFDSISWTVAISSMSYIKDAEFFDEVFLFNESVRTDNDWMVGIPLTEEFRNEIFNTQGFDGIVSIDRILFKLDEHVNPSALTDFIDMKAEGQVTCSIYLYAKEKPLTTFSISDSLFYKRTVNVDMETVFKEIPENFLFNLAYNMGEKLAHNITPSWTTATRIVYVGMEARMQEAYNYSKNNNWATAESIWLKEYNKKSKDSDKGKLANNIALANEMQDKLEEALFWAEKAKEHFLNSNSSKNSYINNYIPELQKRIQNSQMLNFQLLGIDESN